jgi:hypothetical protein
MDGRFVSSDVVRSIDCSDTEGNYRWQVHSFGAGHNYVRNVEFTCKLVTELEMRQCLLLPVSL